MKATLCDGCGLEIDGKPKVVGRLIRREFCPRCAEHGEAFLRNLADCRLQMARDFKEARDAIAADYLERTRLKVLPDWEPSDGS
jgi:hypothetical protein